MAAFPTDPGFKSIDFESVDPTLADETQDGSENVRKTGSQYYRCTLKWNRLTEAEFAPVNAFIESLRGRFTPFTVVLPLISTPQGAGGGSPVVVGAAQTGLVLDVDGCPVSTPGWLKANDVFKLAAQSKVYRLAADADTDGTGAVSLQLVQPLMESPADNEVLTIIDVPFTMRRGSDVQKFTLGDADRFTVELDVREVL